MPRLLPPAAKSSVKLGKGRARGDSNGGARPDDVSELHKGSAQPNAVLVEMLLENRLSPKRCLRLGEDGK